jgi:hypothetical protein
VSNSVELRHPAGDDVGHGAPLRGSASPKAIGQTSHAL